MALFVGFFGDCIASDNASVDCEISSADRERMLRLSFTEFDQKEDDGWRPFYLSKCYTTAAGLIVAYIEQRPEQASKHKMLPFHAGQMLAMAGRYDDAIPYLRLGYSERESKIIDWNAFVDAHIAFIEKDFEKLQRMRARIAAQPEMQSGPSVPEWAVGRRINLDVVDGFLACFDRPFDVAYEAPCRPNQ